MAIFAPDERLPSSATLLPIYYMGQAGLCLVLVNFRQRTQNEFSPASLVQSLESDIGKASTRSAGLALILLCIVYPAPDDRMSIKREVGLQKNRFAKIEFVFFCNRF